MRFGEADLDLFFADMGVPVTAGAESAVGLLDLMDVSVDIGEGMTSTERHPVLRLRADALPSVQPHALITVDGTDYVVRDIRLEDDGLTKVFVLVGNHP